MLTATIDKTKTWSVEDYLQLDEGLLAQLIEGELVISPAPTPKHQRVVRNLYDILRDLQLEGELFFAPIDLFIDKKNVLQPDLVLTRSSNITERGIEGPPDIVVEVVSPSNGFIDRNIKKKKYLAFGVKELWILDPGNKTIEIYSDNIDKPVLYLAEKGLVKSSIIPKMSFELEGIFE